MKLTLKLWREIRLYRMGKTETLADRVAEICLADERAKRAVAFRGEGAEQGSDPNTMVPRADD